MVLHPGLVQQHPAREQMPEVDRAGVRRERGAGQGEAATEGLDQRVGHRPNVALVGAVERGAVLKEELPRPARPQPVQGREALLHRVPHRRGARFQRHHHRVGVRWDIPVPRHPD